MDLLLVGVPGAVYSEGGQVTSILSLLLVLWILLRTGHTRNREELFSI